MLHDDRNSLANDYERKGINESFAINQDSNGNYESYITVVQKFSRDPVTDPGDDSGSSSSQSSDQSSSATAPDGINIDIKETKNCKEEEYFDVASRTCKKNPSD